VTDRGVRALGIDPGTKRIGLAISDRSGTVASPLTVLQRSRSRRHDDAEIARIVRDEEVEVVVVGLPVNMDGSHGASAKAAVAEARRLATVVDVPVELHDERRTTVSADRSMLDAGLNAVERRQRVDKVAAAIMLQSWLDSRANR
jgi:putative Holliday junction resolvase